MVDGLDNIPQRRWAAAYQTHTAAAQLTCWQEMLTAVGHPEAGAAMVDTGEQLVFRPLYVVKVSWATKYTCTGCRVRGLTQPDRA